MPASIYRSGARVWINDCLGNFVHVHNGELRATVVASEWEPWQIIIHGEGQAHLLWPARYENPQDAMADAGEFLDDPARAFATHPFSLQALTTKRQER